MEKESNSPPKSPNSIIKASIMSDQNGIFPSTNSLILAAAAILQRATVSNSQTTNSPPRKIESSKYCNSTTDLYNIEDNRKDDIQKQESENSVPTIKRAQVPKACSNCRRMHAGCDHQRPCKRCTQNGIEDSCSDVPRKKRTSKKRPRIEEAIVGKKEEGSWNDQVFEEIFPQSTLVDTTPASKIQNTGNNLPTLNHLLQNYNSVQNIPIQMQHTNSIFSPHLNLSSPSLQSLSFPSNNQLLNGLPLNVMNPAIINGLLTNYAKPNFPSNPSIAFQTQLQNNFSSSIISANDQFNAIYGHFSSDPSMMLNESGSNETPQLNERSSPPAHSNEPSPTGSGHSNGSSSGSSPEYSTLNNILYEQNTEITDLVKQVNVLKQNNKALERQLAGLTQELTKRSVPTETKSNLSFFGQSSTNWHTFCPQDLAISIWKLNQSKNSSSLVECNDKFVDLIGYPLETLKNGYSCNQLLPLSMKESLNGSWPNEMADMQNKNLPLKTQMLTAKGLETVYMSASSVIDSSTQCRYWIIYTLLAN